MVCCQARSPPLPNRTQARGVWKEWSDLMAGSSQFWLGINKQTHLIMSKANGETRATAVTSWALLSGLGGSGAVGFLNAPTGSASLYLLTALQHSLLESKASEGQKPALETGGLWLCLAPSLPTTVCLKISWVFLQARGGEAAGCCQVLSSPL